MRGGPQPLGRPGLARPVPAGWAGDTDGRRQDGGRAAGARVRTTARGPLRGRQRAGIFPSTPPARHASRCRCGWLSQSNRARRAEEASRDERLFSERAGAVGAVTPGPEKTSATGSGRGVWTPGPRRDVPPKGSLRPPGRLAGPPQEAEGPAEPACRGPHAAEGSLGDRCSACHVWHADAG